MIIIIITIATTKVVICTIKKNYNNLGCQYHCFWVASKTSLTTKPYWRDVNPSYLAVTYCFAKSASCTSMTAVYAEPIWISEHSPSWGVESVNTGMSLQGPDWPLIITRNCNPAALNGRTLSKFVVPAGKSSKVNVTAYVPAVPFSPPYFKTQVVYNSKCTKKIKWNTSISLVIMWLSLLQQ